MKIVQNILSILLVTAFFNVVVAKSLHEFFEHDHGHEHELALCSTKDVNHFHQHEFAHADFICSFNFSVSLVSTFFAELDEVLHFQENKVKIHFLWLAKSLCVRTASLRGPPSGF